MNGRVYDPMLGRFGTPDPMTESPFSTQGWNRYSYVGNSPLNFTDPSGYCFASCFWQGPFKALGAAIRRTPILGNILTVAATAICTAVTGAAPVCGALASAAVTGLASGDLGQALKAGAIALATAAAFQGVGDITGHTPGFGTGEHFANILGHAAVGCGSAVALGGKCGPGALSGAVGSFTSPLTRGLDFTPRLVVTSVSGGLASVAGGGKFGNGAVTAAFGYLFNELGNSAERGYERKAYTGGLVCNGLGAACVQEGAQASSFLEDTALLLSGAGAILRASWTATTTLFRAVGVAEFEQLTATGTFRAGANSLEGKFFAESAEHAARWGELLNGAGNFRVIGATFPRNVADSFMRWQRLDGIGPARYGTLDAINAAGPRIRALP